MNGERNTEPQHVFQCAEEPRICWQRDPSVPTTHIDENPLTVSYVCRSGKLGK